MRPNHLYVTEFLLNRSGALASNETMYCFISGESKCHTQTVLVTTERLFEKCPLDGNCTLGD